MTEMTHEKMPEALRLAEMLLSGAAMIPEIDLPEAASELRRQHAEIERLREDAERYRYVAPMQGFHDFVIHETGCYVDDLVSATRAIDAARKKD